MSKGIILLVISVTLFSIIPLSFASTLFDESEQSLTREGVKWCEEKKPAFDRYGLDTLLRLEENTIETRLCVKLFEDFAWNYQANDRIEHLMLRSNYFAELENAKTNPNQVVLDFEKFPDGVTLIMGGILVEPDFHAVIDETDIDGVPHYKIFESMGILFGENDIIYGRSLPLWNMPSDFLNQLYGNSGNPSENSGYAGSDAIDIYFIHPITKQPKAVSSVKAMILDPETPFTIVAYDLEGKIVDSFTKKDFCWACGFVASVSSDKGISHVRASVERGSTSFGITHLSFISDGIVPVPSMQPTPKPNIPDFIDSKKGAQYYLDRYNNEPAYKQWFDTNYPDYTIEEAIELAITGSFSQPETIQPQPDDEHDVNPVLNDIIKENVKLKIENNDLKMQIDELQKKIDDLNQIIREQIKVIYDWVVSK